MSDTPVPDITVDVNLRNPGQFFACCGLLELASRMWPASDANRWREPEGWFSEQSGRGRFLVATHGGSDDPLEEIVRHLVEADQIVVLTADHATHAPDRKPVMIAPFGLRLDWWLDSYRRGDKSELKVWAGQQTPERNINALRAAWRDVLSSNDPGAKASELFLQRRPLTGRFGFDPSASWKAIDVGFSPDEQDMPVQTSPATEVLAAVGLQRCRPLHVERRSFAYHAWADPLTITLAPAGVAGFARTLCAYAFPVLMRNAQFGNFGWARPREEGA